MKKLFYPASPFNFWFSEKYSDNTNLNMKLGISMKREREGFDFQVKNQSLINIKCGACVGTNFLSPLVITVRF